MNIRRILSGLAIGAAMAAIGSVASAATVSTSVAGTDNIYFVNWGSANNGINVDVTGRGNNVSAVADIGGAIDFAGLGPLMSITSGQVVDNGTQATGPDGFASLFNGLRVYSMIGVWSSTSGSITPIGDSFFVGASAIVGVPNVANAFLFLGENDGIFSDNSGAYSVRITYGAQVVPLPAGLPLLASALGLGLVFGRRRRPA